MGYHFATLGLGPVLLVQGRHVRRNTPVLPEPDGPREGSTGDGPPLRLLIAGDSATAGVGAAAQSEALSGQLTAALAPHYRLDWRLIARTGWTAQNLLDELRAHSVQEVDTAVVAVGVNDATGGTPPAQWLRSQQRLVQLLQSHWRARRILLCGVPPMHLFPALPQPLRWYMGLRARRLNAALSGWVTKAAGCEFVVPELGDRAAQLMAADGFHPGPAGYTVWARQLATRIQAQQETHGQ